MKTAIIWMLLASAFTLVACESNPDNRDFWLRQEKSWKN